MTFWQARTSFILTTEPGLNECFWKTTILVASQAHGSYFTLACPRGAYGSVGEGGRMGILKPLLLCHERPALGGMDVFVGAPSILTKLHKWRDIWQGPLKEMVPMQLEDIVFLEAFFCMVAFRTGGEMFLDAVLGKSALGCNAPDRLPPAFFWPIFASFHHCAVLSCCWWLPQPLFVL